MVIYCFILISKKSVARASKSEPDLGTADKQFIPLGFPPGTTVDELWLYRKKKPPDDSYWSRDNLDLLEGSFKSLKSEYIENFRNYFTDDLRFIKKDNQNIGNISKSRSCIEIVPEYKEASPIEPLNNEQTKIIDVHQINVNEISRKTEETNYSNSKSLRYRHPCRRPTNLKIEGEFYTKTEQSDQFTEYLLSEKPFLIKQPTNLKLEGNMQTSTETHDKFIQYDLQQRPPLCKKFTNLHLDGDLTILTEQQDQFRTYKYTSRPPLIKKPTNLHIEGDIKSITEYRGKFIPYKNPERSEIVVPINNLKTDGFYDDTVKNNITNFDKQIHPYIPFLRDDENMAISPLNENISIPKRKSHHMIDVCSESRSQFVEKTPIKTDIKQVTNNLHLEGGIDMNPEYKDAYINYHKDGRFSPARKTVRQPNLKLENGKMDVFPEYRSSYVDFPRERPKTKKPKCALTNKGEMKSLTEKREEFIPYSNISKREPLKIDSELKLEGRFECEPEYRKAYIDYIQRENIERKSRPIPNFNVSPKRVFDDSIEFLNKINNKKKPTKSSLSIPSSPKKFTRQLSQLETQAFGPKLIVTSPSINSDEVIRRFDKSVIVENIASNQRQKPLQPHLINANNKNKWMKDNTELNLNSSFYVIDNDINNNCYDFKRNKCFYK